MQVKVHEDNTGIAPPDCRWTAIDSDTYDGAPDAGVRRIMGNGTTPEAAIADLLDRLDEGEPWQQADAQAYRSGLIGVGA